jgi:hypothetical protein
MSYAHNKRKGTVRKFKKKYGKFWKIEYQKFVDDIKETLNKSK